MYCLHKSKEHYCVLLLHEGDFHKCSCGATWHSIDSDKAIEEKNDSINHPKHYTNHPSGIECIDVVEHMTFNLGNAVKYIWRHDLKNGLEDLGKAKWYIEREIERLEKDAKRGT